MGHKESNLANTVGVLPAVGASPIPVGKIPDGGTQVLKNGIAENTTDIIYTITTGKTLYLSAVTIGIRFTAEVSGSAQLFLRDEDDLNAVIIFNLTRGANNGFCCGQSFFPPAEIPALWDICIYSNPAGIHAYGFIHGYEA